MDGTQGGTAEPTFSIRWDPIPRYHDSILRGLNPFLFFWNRLSYAKPCAHSANTFEGHFNKATCGCRCHHQTRGGGRSRPCVAGRSANPTPTSSWRQKPLLVTGFRPKPPINDPIEKTQRLKDQVARVLVDFCGNYWIIDALLINLNPAWAIWSICFSFLYAACITWV